MDPIVSSERVRNLAGLVESSKVMSTMLTRISLLFTCGPGHLSRGVLGILSISVIPRKRREVKVGIKSKVFLFIIQSAEFKVYYITCLSVVATNRPFK